jgi:hypothetical protein
LVVRHSTFDGNEIWLGLQQHGSTLSTASIYPIRSLALDQENGVDGCRLCTIIFLYLRLFTAQIGTHYHRDDSAPAAAISSPGVPLL